MKELFFGGDFIEESRKNVRYKREVLLDKKTVNTVAVLEIIPHNDNDTVDICLKIGRYKKPTGELEVSNPKSELTLSSIELNNLTACIGKFYKPLEMNASHFVDLNDQPRSATNIA